MEKPIKKKHGNKLSFLYLDCSAFLEEKYGFEHRDVLGSLLVYDQWRQTKGHTGLDPDGKDPGSSQIWWKEYQDDLQKGLITEPEYLDFWHWVVDHHTISNGCFITFSQQEFDEIEEDWVKTIYQRWLDEFGGESKTIPLYVWW